MRNLILVGWPRVLKSLAKILIGILFFDSSFDVSSVFQQILE